MNTQDKHHKSGTLNRTTLFFFCLFGVGACHLALAKEPPVLRDCCGGENYVYRPSSERIPISNSPNLNKQLSLLQAKPKEQDQLRKAIKAGNYVLQAYVNQDLFSMGSENHPPQIAEGWLKYYAPYVAVSVEEFQQILRKESPDCCYGGVSKDPRHGRLVCPFARLDSAKVLHDKTILTYQFIHIARHPGLGTGIGVIKYPLELADNGKVGNFEIAVNSNFKYIPNDPDTIDWWSMQTTRGLKEQVMLRLSGNVYEDLKPKLRELQTELHNAEQICHQKNLFDRS